MSVEKAKNPDTLPSLLTELANSEEKEIVLAVAKNPSTPLETLLLLAESYPKAFLENEALPLLFIKKPNLLDSLSEKAAEALVDTKVLPYFVLEGLTLHPDEHVRTGVAMNPNTPLPRLETLAKDENEYVRLAVAGNQNTPLSCLQVLSHDAHDFVRCYVAQNAKTPVTCLQALANDKSEYVRAGVAQNAKTPIALLQALTKDESEYVREGVAKNPNTPASCLQALAKDENKEVREYAKSALTLRKEEGAEKKPTKKRKTRKPKVK